MRYKLLGYAILVLILAAIVSVTFVYQLRNSIRIEPVVHQNKIETYKNPDLGFEVQYDSKYTFVAQTEQKPGDQVDPKSFEANEMPIGSIDLPQSLYPNTNFVEASVFLGSATAFNAALCEKFNIIAAKLGTEVVNGMKFSKAEYDGVGAGNLYESRVYRIFHGGNCYEVSLNVHTSNIGNYPGGSVREVNKGEVWSKLVQILNTFKFENSNDVSSDKVPPVTPNPKPNPTAGEGILKGHVDIGPLCGGPERIDMPCATKPDYSSTQILVYTKNNSTVFKTLGLDTSGNYSVELVAGNYLVNYKTNYGLPQVPTPQTVTVAVGKVVTIDFNIDTGIR